MTSTKDSVDEQHGSSDGSSVIAPEDAGDSLRAMAADVVAATLRRAEYEALKVLAWRFPHGTHITAMPVGNDRKAEHHAVYVSSEEVISKRWPDGLVINETWISFMMKYPLWRVANWPKTAIHGDEIVQRARDQVGKEESYSEILCNSEHFVQECYTGVASSSNVRSGATAIAGCATASSATGAAIALPFAYSSTAVYALGIIPWGTATVFSGGVIAAGALLGAAVGSTVVAPTMWSWRQSAREASLSRLAFCILNQSTRHLQVSAYRVDDAYRRIAVVGIAGQSSGYIAPEHILELDPPHDAEEFQIEVTFGQAVAPEAETWIGSAASAAWSAGSLAASLVPRLPYISAQPFEGLRAIVRRGSVYRVSDRLPQQQHQGDCLTSTSELDPAALLELSEIPQTVLPAYYPGF